MRPPPWSAGLLVGVLAGASWATAQEPVSVSVSFDGLTATAQTARDMGYTAAPLAVLEALGASVTSSAGRWRVSLDGRELELAAGSPFLRAGGGILQLADAPYTRGRALFVPLQLLLDVLPQVLSESYQPRAAAAPFPGPTPGGSSERRGSPPASPSPVTGSPRSAPDAPSREDQPVPASRKRVVVVDPGHGGSDPGALGAGGAREKDIALAVGRALVAELERYPELEVHLTREEDVLVPLWQRGDWATSARGDRPGIFISLHANALPGQRATRGFETYFLSDARTDHERRVAANENAPLAMAAGDGGFEAPPDLDFILRELRNLDHQHWSALLAELIQRELAPVHPGPDRGVKQGPFAVITNALMPAVLVEMGFITHRQEERLLLQEEFHQDAARALARAVVGFFERYPPGQAVSLGGGG